ncbi:hypothetical protein [Segniliparus rugosus]|uniref:Uncharacterized protein n=1 Tax=Segniliparus rugosus (strain ATCC BAA-974 / DSM 45345 / CCUG 50838 / CIP 108380 / JCM 13579 / CDC 945) TaxID=679197 RepID=E5XPP7_SEGRC|nr:hypothetical protein [Segniliparus rugosus]EFV13645.1 hypothetical protein HMPREF9336_01469 [Segniliparus rugosus ATCC BAA-974]
MTTPNLSQPVLIASVAWPAHKALAVLVAVAVLLGALMATATAQFAFALALAGGMLVSWIFAPRSPLTRSR